MCPVGVNPAERFGNVTLPGRERNIVASPTGTGGRHVRYPEGTPLANLHLSLLDKLGVPADSLGHANGKLPLDPLSAA